MALSSLEHRLKKLEIGTGVASGHCICSGGQAIIVAVRYPGQEPSLGSAVPRCDRCGGLINRVIINVVYDPPRVKKELK